MDEETIRRCTLFLMSLMDKEVAVPLKDLDLFLNIHEVREECIEELIELLEKERPVKPLGNLREECLCRCGLDLYNKSYKDNYCSDCGQRIDWGADVE